MEKFFDKEGLIDTLHTRLTKGKISMSDYRMWFHQNNKSKISILTPLGETDRATIMNGIGQGSVAAGGIIKLALWELAAFFKYFARVSVNCGVQNHLNELNSPEVSIL